MADDFLFNFESILLAKQQNLKIAEVPVIANYKLDHRSINYLVKILLFHIK